MFGTHGAYLCVKVIASEDVEKYLTSSYISLSGRGQCEMCCLRPFVLLYNTAPWYKTRMLKGHSADQRCYDRYPAIKAGQIAGGRDEQTRYETE